MTRNVLLAHPFLYSVLGSNAYVGIMPLQKAFFEASLKTCKQNPDLLKNVKNKLFALLNLHSLYAEPIWQQAPGRQAAGSGPFTVRHALILFIPEGCTSHEPSRYMIFF